MSESEDVSIDCYYFKNFRNVAEQLIDKGFATALRHRRDDEDRSADYDKLMAAEQAYVINDTLTHRH